MAIENVKYRITLRAKFLLNMKMKAFSMVLIIILMIAAVLPANVGFKLMFYPKDAALSMNISAVNEDVTRAMLVLSAYIISWVVLYALSLVWILRKKKEGMTLALFLGIVTLGRGLLLIYFYNTHDLGDSIVAYIMITIGAALTASATLALREVSKPESE